MNQNNHMTDIYFHNHDHQDNEIKMDGIDMNDFKDFDGD
jgi:hypothetical protein